MGQRRHARGVDPWDGHFDHADTAGEIAVRTDSTVVGTGEHCAQAPEVFDELRALPPTDVQAGAVLGFNQLTNGLRDPAMYVAALCPKVFIPLHHDFVTEYGSADDYEAPMRRELEFYGTSPRLRWLVDPRPELMTFELNTRGWQVPAEPGCATDS